MDLRKLLFVLVVGFLTAAGLSACKSQTEIHNEGATGTTSDQPAEVHTTKETVRIQGEPDDPKDHDADRVETRTKTEVDR
jgi:hypothetical protein